MKILKTPQPRYYYYNSVGDRCGKGEFYVVSEIKLPKPDVRFRKKSAWLSKNVPRRLKLGTILDLAFGISPKVLRKCEIVSVAKNPAPIYVPYGIWNKEVGEIRKEKIKDRLVIKYKGKKIWGDRQFFCLLKNLK